MIRSRTLHHNCAFPDMFDKLPDCLLCDILEYACEDIVRDCGAVDIKGVPRYGAHVRRFLWLLLINRRFFSLLSTTVLVEGRPVRKKLLDMAEDKFKGLLFTRDPVPRDSNVERHSCHRISELRVWCACGPIWMSPRAGSLHEHIFWFLNQLHPHLFLRFVYHLPVHLRQYFKETDSPKDDTCRHPTVEHAKKITPPRIAGEVLVWARDKKPVLAFTVGHRRFGSYGNLRPGTKHYNCVSLKGVGIGDGENKYCKCEDDDSLWLWYIIRGSDRSLSRFIVLNYKTEAVYDTVYERWLSKDVWDVKELPEIEADISL